MRKRLLIVTILTVFAVVLVAGPALARGGGYWVYSVTASGHDEAAINGAASAANAMADGLPVTFLTPGAGNNLLFDVPNGNPHAGYVSTGGKCKVCHAVHGAGLNEAQSTTMPTTERLLRTSVSEACVYCHITTNFGTLVYEGNINNYLGDGAAGSYHRVGGSGHAAGHRQVAAANAKYEGCASCHAVHGAQTIGDGTSILKNDPAKGTVASVEVTAGQGFGSFAAPVTNQRDFCLDCHDGTRRVFMDSSIQQINNQTQFNAAFPACAGCHNSVAANIGSSSHSTQFGVSTSPARNGRSHVMTTQTISDGTQIAFHPTALGSEGITADANSCTTCHNTVDEGFPHFSAGNEALISGFDEPTHLDGVCLSCHQDGGGNGVGLTF